MSRYSVKIKLETIKLIKLYKKITPVEVAKILTKNGMPCSLEGLDFATRGLKILTEKTGQKTTVLHFPSGKRTIEDATITYFIV